MNLGIAFHNLRSTSWELFPCFGMKSSGDSLAIQQSKWFSVPGKPIPSMVQKIIEETNTIHFWDNQHNLSSPLSNSLIRKMYQYTQKWMKVQFVRLIYFYFYFK